MTASTQSINEKTVNQTVFVKQRYGLGYSENQDSEGTYSSENEKVRRELAEKNEALSLALQTTRDKNEFLAEKIKVLESRPQEEQTWFDGQNAHHMYVNQAKGTRGKGIDFDQRKGERPFRPGKGKYGYIPYNRVCWHCGKNGHYINDCPKKRNLRNNHRNNVPMVVNLKDPAYNVPVPNYQRNNHYAKNYATNHPGKAKLRWVPKA